jgi:hypothetical protein
MVKNAKGESHAILNKISTFIGLLDTEVYREPLKIAFWPDVGVVLKF